MRWLEAIDLARQERLVTGQPLRDALSAAYDELQAIAAEIRQLPGHEGFLAPLRWDDLASALGRVPLIYIVHTAVGGAALLAWSADDISTLWLDELTHQSIEAQVFGGDGTSGYVAVYRAWRAEPSETHRAAWQDALASCNDWLRRVVMVPLGNALRDRDVDGAVLVSTGLLALLPLHAAETDIAFAFAPNGRALARDPDAPDPRGLDRAMIVEKPNPDGPLALPFARLEVQGLQAHLLSTEHLRLAGAEARAEHVLDAMTSYRLWHLATHAGAEPREALDSFLLFAHEERVSLRTLLSLRAKADLVVLSACETGIPQMDVPDEVISLATGMLQAGARGVVSSLWAVNDLSTALLMGRFYRELCQDGDFRPRASPIGDTLLRVLGRQDDGPAIAGGRHGKVVHIVARQLERGLAADTWFGVGGERCEAIDLLKDTEVARGGLQGVKATEVLIMCNSQRHGSICVLTVTGV